VTRAILLCLSFAIASPAWVESVEFPWNAIPKPLWERQLVWLKNAGITHVSLPPAKDEASLLDLIRIVRRLDMEADLEGAVPDSMAALTRAHGGPLTDPLPGSPMRLSALAPDALTHSRQLLAGGAPALLWIDVADTFGPAGYKPGAVSFTGADRSAAASLQRNAQLSGYWNKTFAAFETMKGAGSVRAENTPPVSGPAVQQFGAEAGASVVSVVNSGAKAWTGELRVIYPPAKRLMSIPVVTVGAQDALWLPVNVPLSAGPLCKDCTAFANGDNLVYATAELTAMEYENGILAMEFAAPAPAEVILQLSQEPSGPLVAGGRPSSFDWDDKNSRARLTIPAGSGPDKHVRIGLAIEPPDATAFFDSARVLMIGEANPLTAQFSSEAIAQRSRLRVSPAFANLQESGKEPLALIYKVTVPENAVHGDHADLAIEADGMQMSHARPQLLRPVEVKFPDAMDVRVAANAALPLFPATVGVNQRAGRELLVTLKNNAPEIRTFVLEPKAEGLEFSPAKLEVTVGVSTSRDVSFRVFARDAAPGLHTGAVTVSGAAKWSEPMQFVVIPQSGAVAYTTSGFSFLESGKVRAAFMPGRWLEYVNKDNNQNLLPAGGVAGTNFEAQKNLRLEDLESMIPKPKR
jgi:hypothetical protein